MKFDYKKIISENKIGIIGVGGAGGIIADLFAKTHGSGENPIAIDSDLNALACKKFVKHKIVIGAAVCKGCGCRAEPDTGKRAARESEADIRRALNGFERIIVVTGLGGGCGSGATPEILKIANDMDIQTTVVAAVAFNVEIPPDADYGNHLMETAKTASDKIKGLAGYFDFIALDDRSAYNEILTELRKVKMLR